MLIPSQDHAAIYCSSGSLYPPLPHNGLSSVFASFFRVVLDCPRSRGWNRDSNAGRYLGGNSKQYDSEVGVEQGREGSWYDCDLKQVTSLGNWAPYSNVVPWQTVQKGVPRLSPPGDEKVEILILLVQGCWPLQHFQLAPWSGPGASTGKVSAKDIVGRAHWQRLLHLHWHFWSAQASFVECSSS